MSFEVPQCHLLAHFSVFFSQRGLGFFVHRLRCKVSVVFLNSKINKLASNEQDILGMPMYIKGHNTLHMLNNHF